MVLSILVFAGLLFVLGEEPVPAARRLRPVGLVVALLLAIGGAISVENSSHAALRIRFEASRSDFETVVAEAGAPTSRDGRGDFPGPCPGRIGSYALGRCEAIDRGYLLLQQRAALGDDAGFAYLPDGLPSEDPHREWRLAAGPVLPSQRSLVRLVVRLLTARRAAGPRTVAP